MPEKKDACLEAVAGKVRIQAKGDIWALSAVKGKKDTYTIRSYSRKSGCLKYLAAAAACSDNFLQLDAKDDGSGRQRWTITPVKPSSSPPPLPQFVEIPAVNYSIAVTGYTKQSFGAPQQTAFCNSIYNSTTYPQDYMKCVISFVSEFSYQESSSPSSGRKLAQSGTVYVRGYTAFEFIYNNNTSQQQAQDAADGLFKKMDSPATLQTMFQSSFSSSTVTPDAVDRGEVPVPESTLPTPDSPSPSPTPSSPTPSSPSSPTPTSPSPEPSSPTLSPTFNTVPGGDGVSNLPPVTSPVPLPTPVPTPNPTPTPSPIGIDAYAFITNVIGNSVTSCSIVNGAINTCGTPNSGPAVGTFVNPYGIAIYGGTAFISSYSANAITACTITAGVITTCDTPFTGGSFNSPVGIAISGSTMFVANSGSVGATANSIVACTISGGTINSCGTPYTGPTAGTFTSPRYIAISGSTAYITNINGASITACTISAGAITTCGAPYIGSGNFASPSGIAISGSTIYVTSFGSASVIACTVSGLNISGCSRFPLSSFSGPMGIAISGSTAYLTSFTSSSIIACAISPGNVDGCTTPYTGPTGGTFFNPAGIAIASTLN